MFCRLNKNGFHLGVHPEKTSPDPEDPPNMGFIGSVHDGML